jgi:hypothetical protein
MDYIKQAKDFLKSTKKKIKIHYVGKDINKLWGEKEYRNLYEISILNIGSDHPLMTFKFWDSLNNSRNDNKQPPSEYDVLTCLQKYDCGTFENFCVEYGYDEDSKKAEKIYNLCCEEYKNLCKIFTEEQMRQLREIY